jgi:hypothetical protein
MLPQMPLPFFVVKGSCAEILDVLEKITSVAGDEMMSEACADTSMELMNLGKV